MRLKQYAKSAMIVASTVLIIATDYAVADDIIRIASPYKVQNLDPVRSAAAGTIERAPGMAHLPSFWRKSEVIKRPPLPDGRATPTRQGQFPEMGRPKEA